MEWQPIETAPIGKNGFAWMMLAYGDPRDPSTSIGMRFGERFFAASTFYCFGNEKKFEFREHEVTPTHWMPLPEAPNV